MGSTTGASIGSGSRKEDQGPLPRHGDFNDSYFKRKLKTSKKVISHLKKTPTPLPAVLAAGFLPM